MMLLSPHRTRRHADIPWTIVCLLFLSSCSRHHENAIVQAADVWHETTMDSVAQEIVREAKATPMASMFPDSLAFDSGTPSGTTRVNVFTADGDARILASSVLNRHLGPDRNTLDGADPACCVRTWSTESSLCMVVACYDSLLEKTLLLFESN